ncbi:MAG: hypothetical protein WCQ16_07910 [Verrucomicrobiae bacterium]
MAFSYFARNITALDAGQTVVAGREGTLLKNALLFALYEIFAKMPLPALQLDIAPALVTRLAEKFLDREK